MNNKFKFILSALFVLSSATYCFAQNNGNTMTVTNATANATMITPINLVQTAGVNLNFGSVVGSVAGTVILLPAGTGAPTYSTGLLGYAGSGATPTAASFTVSGNKSASYNLTLPSTPLTLVGPSGSTAMTVTAMTTNLGSLTSGSLTSNLGTTGSILFYIGGTLNVGASQAAGAYLSAPFEVKVNYN